MLEDSEVGYSSPPTESLGGKIEADRRLPVVDAMSELPLSRIGRQWKIITEIARRCILDSPQVREALLPFCKKCLSEEMPGSFTEVLKAVDPKFADLVNQYDDLSKYLALPTVPDKVLEPDISHAPPRTYTTEELKAIEEEFGQDSMRVVHARRNQLRALMNRGNPSGRTPEEYELVAGRYAKARDVKILALSAEILNQGRLVVPNKNGEVVLPSGIRLIIDPERDLEIKEFLSPHLWEKRKQLKDRVYEIEVNGKRYLLKEKKTARHRDTKEHGHIDGRMSEEEFVIAKEFQDKAKIEKGDIKLSWEKPIGFAVYPDGFQFVVYDFEEGLTDQNVTFNLANVILEHEAQFRKEYEGIKDAAVRYKNDPRSTGYRDEVIVLKPSTEKNYRRLTRLLSIVKNRSSQEGKPQRELQLSFRDYALVKSKYMVDEARELMEETILDMGYSNSDLDGNAFRIIDGDRVRLEIVGFDFEYYRKISDEKVAERRKSEEEYDRSTRQDLGFAEWSSGEAVTKIQNGAYLALLKKAGRLRSLDSDGEVDH